ncbi:hypothetical protein MUG91_G105n35 [Manis pentadactyla]|nr:hypothetical protein MUG91_G105n35 [Manis pentadactyla]
MEISWALYKQCDLLSAHGTTSAESLNFLKWKRAQLIVSPSVKDPLTRKPPVAFCSVHSLTSRKDFPKQLGIELSLRISENGDLMEETAGR